MIERVVFVAIENKDNIKFNLQKFRTLHPGDYNVS